MHRLEKNFINSSETAPYIDVNFIHQNEIDLLAFGLRKTAAKNPFIWVHREMRFKASFSFLIVSGYVSKRNMKVFTEPPSDTVGTHDKAVAHESHRIPLVRMNWYTPAAGQTTRKG